MKAFASDIDGTLLFHGEVSNDDVEMIRLYQEKGNIFGLCTGRNPYSIRHLFPSSISPDFLILCTGALILNKELEILFSKAILFEDGKGIFDLVKNEGNLIIHTYDFDWFYGHLKNDGRYKMKYVEDYNDLHGKDVYCISLLTDTFEHASKINEMINKAYPNIQGYVNGASCDFVSKGCSKGTGIQFIKEYYDIETMAGMGDNYNDIPMLEAVDIPYTFASAPQELKDISNIEDSVANALRNEQ